jgi:hypothetical protein
LLDTLDGRLRVLLLKECKKVGDEVILMVAVDRLKTLDGLKSAKYKLLVVSMWVVGNPGNLPPDQVNF